MKIILYSNDCPKCKILKTKLEEKNISYEIFNTIDEMIERGFRSLPILEVDGKIMTFIEAVEWVKGE
ncbi:MAG TPA: hypothetical protein DER56_03085 [Thermosipho africanus]|nr:hypothetical protein [Thermosipho africanus]